MSNSFAAALSCIVLALAPAAVGAAPASPQEIARKYARHSVRAVPRNAFPVLFDPPMSPAAAGDRYFRADEWVIGVAIGGESKAYPITVMGIHELINDTVGGRPITVCW